MTKRESQLPVREGDSDDLHGATYRHPAFGTISVSEISGGSRVLFGSDVDHQYRICLRIGRASLRRNLSNDWIHPSNSAMVEVEMSHAQFAALAGSVGKGSGVPCTLLYAPTNPAAQMVPSIERLETKLDTFAREVEASAKRQIEELQAQIARMGAALESGKLGVKEAREIHRNLSITSANLPSNLAYTVDQAQRMLETASNDAKTQIETFAESTARRLGQDSLGLDSLAGIEQSAPADRIKEVLDFYDQSGAGDEGNASA